MNEEELRDKFEATFPIPLGVSYVESFNGYFSGFSTYREIGARYNAKYDGWKACAESMKAEMDALRADAERYRWLRDKSFNGNGTSSSPQVNMSDDRGIIYGLELDCTIDQARGKP